MLFGAEKAYGETDWKRRIGYRLFGELHIPGRLRIWHVMKELDRLGFWSHRPLVLLDAGGGEGAFAYFVARKFPEWSVVVIDNDAITLSHGERIKAALALDNLTLRHGDLHDFRDESVYDVIVCSDVLEHIEDDELVVKQLVRSLKPEGVAIFTSPGVPQPKHLQLVSWRERRIGFKPSDYGHVRQGYSELTLSSLMRDAGLEIEQVQRTFGPFGTLMFDIFFITGDSRPNPAVYMALLPTYLALSVLDLAIPSRHGAGVLAVGCKPTKRLREAKAHNAKRES